VDLSCRKLIVLPQKLSSFRVTKKKKVILAKFEISLQNCEKLQEFVRTLLGWIAVWVVLMDNFR
jgi:hypothetical protein